MTIGMDMDITEEGGTDGGGAKEGAGTGVTRTADGTGERDELGVGSLA